MYTLHRDKPWSLFVAPYFEINPSLYETYYKDQITTHLFQDPLFGKMDIPHSKRAEYINSSKTTIDMKLENIQYYTNVFCDGTWGHSSISEVEIQFPYTKKHQINASYNFPAVLRVRKSLIEYVMPNGVDRYWKEDWKQCLACYDRDNRMQIYVENKYPQSCLDKKYTNSCNSCIESLSEERNFAENSPRNSVYSVASSIFETEKGGTNFEWQFDTF